MGMTSSRPYLIRGVYDWIIDNQYTPYILVDVTNKDVVVPMQYVDNGRIVLNIGTLAVNQINIGNNSIDFVARFNGQAIDINIPCDAVLAIFAKEIGQGMVFKGKSASTIETTDASISMQQKHGKIKEKKPKKSTKPSLKLVK